jgi:hypothetical protein
MLIEKFPVPVSFLEAGRLLLQNVKGGFFVNFCFFSFLSFPEFKSFCSHERIYINPEGMLSVRSVVYCGFSLLIL